MFNNIHRNHVDVRKHSPVQHDLPPLFRLRLPCAGRKQVCVNPTLCAPFPLNIKSRVSHAAILGDKTAGEVDVRPLHDNAELSFGSRGAIRRISLWSLPLKAGLLFFFCHGFKATTNFGQKEFKCFISKNDKTNHTDKQPFNKPAAIKSHLRSDTAVTVKPCRSSSLAVRATRYTRYLSTLIRFSNSQNGPELIINAVSAKQKRHSEGKKLPLETFSHDLQSFPKVKVICTVTNCQWSRTQMLPLLLALF